MSRAVLGMFLALVLTDVGLSASSASESPDAVMNFADRLYEERDYYRAITEYKRFAFLHPEDPRALRAEFQVGMCYLNGEKPDAAVQVFDALADRHPTHALGIEALRMMATAHAQAERYRAAQDALETLRMRVPAGDLDALRLQIGWYDLCRGDVDAAKAHFHAVETNAIHAAQVRRLLESAEAYEEIPRRSPALAGALSTLIPGAGQLYVGRPRDAVLAFAVNGALIWAAVEAFDNEQHFAGSLFVLLDVSWYAGNIYNAVNGAHKINRSRVRSFLDEAAINCGFACDGALDDRPVPVLALRFGF